MGKPFFEVFPSLKLDGGIHDIIGADQRGEDICHEEQGFFEDLSVQHQVDYQG